MLEFCLALACPHALVFFFFFNDTATTEIYTLSLHDALPICPAPVACLERAAAGVANGIREAGGCLRSEEHTSELQSQSNLVCRLLLEKKKTLALAPAGPHSRTALSRREDAAAKDLHLTVTAT